MQFTELPTSRKPGISMAAELAIQSMMPELRAHKPKVAIYEEVTPSTLPLSKSNEYARLAAKRDKLKAAAHHAEVTDFKAWIRMTEEGTAILYVGAV